MTTVKMPSANDLLGDKLTAFAPNTTGIPYFKHGNSMNMEINKQLYDVSCLFDLFDDLNAVRDAPLGGCLEMMLSKLLTLLFSGMC